MSDHCSNIKYHMLSLPIITSNIVTDNTQTNRVCRSIWQLQSLGNNLLHSLSKMSISIQCLFKKKIISAYACTDRLTLSTLNSREHCLTLTHYQPLKWPYAGHMLAKRFISYIQRYLSCDSEVIKFMTSYSIMVGHMASPIGPSALFCSSEFGFCTSWYFCCVIAVLFTRVFL